MKLTELTQAQALRASIDLTPIDGAGGRIFPPTYPRPVGAKEKEPRHVVEKLPSGERRVLIDSVASQANRQEAALVAARSKGLIDFADVYLDLSGTEADIARLSATEMPHRLSDAMLRDSEIDGLPFARNALGQRLLATKPGDLTAILETSPTTLLYGCWFSQHGSAQRLTIQRCTTSEIWAYNAVLGKAVGSRIDPLGIEKIDLYEARAGDWTALAEKAVKVGDKPKPLGRKPSELNHGNIPPSIRRQGITAERVQLRWALPLAAVRRPVDRRRLPEHRERASATFSAISHGSSGSRRPMRRRIRRRRHHHRRLLHEAVLLRRTSEMFLRRSRISSIRLAARSLTAEASRTSWARFSLRRRRA